MLQTEPAVRAPGSRRQGKSPSARSRVSGWPQRNRAATQKRAASPLHAPIPMVERVLPHRAFGILFEEPEHFGRAVGVGRSGASHQFRVV